MRSAQQHRSWYVRIAPALLSAVLLASPVFAAPSDAQRIERILEQTPLIDGHDDLPCEIRARFDGDLTDIPRLRAGHVGAQFWSVWIPADTQGRAAVQMTIEQIDLVKQGRGWPVTSPRACRVVAVLSPRGDRAGSDALRTPRR